ncbi:MAG: LPXTG cell wall anchor domain-containing protein [Streptomycetaceae bacterium]|nr:LPXTG cell wall anchor domain-containing protein [Streptomycetaceae bacterium]
MKLRRALVSVATTAALTPAVLMAAPAAFANAAVPPAPAASTTPTPTPTPTIPAPPAPPAPPKGLLTPSVSPTPSTAPSMHPPIKPSPKPSAPATDPWSTDCTKADVDTNSVLQMSLSGLPSKIVAGSGWHQFTLTATNPTKQSLGKVVWVAGVDNGDDTLLKYSRIEYFNGKTWLDLKQQLSGTGVTEQQLGTTGVAFGETTLGASQTLKVQLRVSIDSKAPAGLSGAVGIGGYIDAAKNCTHTTLTVYMFKVLAPGSTVVDPAPAKPDPSAKPPVQIKTPVGGPTELPATGTLAHTGASSQLPMIAGLSGVAIAAGAGAMFVVRRRKVGAEA